MIAVMRVGFLAISSSVLPSETYLLFTNFTNLWRVIVNIYLGILDRSTQTYPRNWITLRLYSSLNFTSTILIFPYSTSASIFFRYAHYYSAIHFTGLTGSTFSGFSSKTGRGLGIGLHYTWKKGWLFTWGQSKRFWCDFWSIPSISSRSIDDIYFGYFTA